MYLLELSCVALTFAANYTCNTRSRHIDEVIAQKMIYFIPHYADSIGEFNPVTNTFSIIDVSSRAMGAAGQRDFGEIQTSRNVFWGHPREV